MVAKKGKLVYIPSSVTLYQFYDPPTNLTQEYNVHVGKAVKRYKKTYEPKNVLVLRGSLGRGLYAEVLYDSERWFVETKNTYSVGGEQC